MSDELNVLQRLRDADELLREVAACRGNELSIQRKLRSRWDDDLVRAALSLVDVRRRAEGTLDRPDRLWLTQTGLEQATHPVVARHKAVRFPAAEPVFDLCSGIGSDAAALIDRGPVTVVDSDAAMLQRCRWNLDVWNRPPKRALVADVRDLDLQDALVHVDPDRRIGRSRPTRRLEQYVPDLDWMRELVQTAAGGAIKLGPASNFIRKFGGCEIELVSLFGECREATVWFGALADVEQFRATVLPWGETISGDPLDSWAESAGEPGAYILDPDPAVVRSGLIDAVCEQFALRRLDPEEEYLTSDHVPDSAFVTAFEVECVLANNEKKLRQYLRSNPGQRYEIKCRRIPVNTAALEKKLPVGGTDIKVILFVRAQGRAKIVVARRCAGDSEQRA